MYSMDCIQIDSIHATMQSLQHQMSLNSVLPLGRSVLAIVSPKINVLKALRLKEFSETIN